MAAIRVPIVSEFNKAGITSADKALQKFGISSTKSLAKFGAGAAVAGKVALDAFKSMDAGFDAIIAGTGASGAALTGLQDDAKAVARNVPQDFGTVGSAIADVNTRLGLTGPKLQETTKRFLDLSRVTGVDVSTNIANVTRVFGDWSVATDDQAKTMDLLLTASQATGIEIDRLTGLVVQFGAPLRQMGFSLEESVAIFGKFEKEGVNIETVMSGLRQGLGRMAKAGEEPVETFKRLVEQIKNAGTTGDANAIALKAFGQRAGPDMAAAIREGRFELDDLLSTLDDSEGSLTRTSDQMLSFTDKLDMMKNRLLVASIPALTEMAGVIEDDLIPVLEDAGDLLGYLDVGAKKATGGQMGLAKAAGLSVRNMLLGNNVMSDATDLLWGQAEATEAATDATKLNDRASAGSAASSRNAAAAAEYRAAATEEATAAEEDATEAAKEALAVLREQKRKTDDLITSKLRLVGGDIAVRDAQRQANEAAAALTETLSNQETTLGEAGAAIDAAAASQLAAAEAAASYRYEQGEANGITYSAKDRARIYKEELERLAGQVDGPLREALQRYIDDLNRIPTNINTRVSTSTTGGGIGISGYRASGGPVGAGLYEVNENGDELLQKNGRTYLMSSGPGNVVPIKNTPAASAAGGGGTNVVINVSVGAGADMTEAGRRIAQALDAYYRTGGRRVG